MGELSTAGQNILQARMLQLQDIISTLANQRSRIDDEIKAAMQELRQKQGTLKQLEKSPPKLRKFIVVELFRMPDGTRRYVPQTGEQDTSLTLMSAAWKTMRKEYLPIAVKVGEGTWRMCASPVECGWLETLEDLDRWLPTGVDRRNVRMVSTKLSALMPFDSYLALYRTSVELIKKVFDGQALPYYLREPEIRTVFPQKAIKGPKVNAMVRKRKGKRPPQETGEPLVVHTVTETVVPMGEALPKKWHVAPNNLPPVNLRKHQHVCIYCGESFTCTETEDYRCPLHCRKQICRDAHTEAFKDVVPQ